MNLRTLEAHRLACRYVGDVDHSICNAEPAHTIFQSRLDKGQIRRIGAVTADIHKSIIIRMSLLDQLH